MKRILTRRLSLLACAAAVITAFAVLPSSASAQTPPPNQWTCRGTGLRIGTFELGTANAPDAPCKSQVAFPINLHLPLGGLLDLQVLGLGSATDASRAGGGFGNGVSSQAGAVGVTLRLLGLTLQTGLTRNIGFANCGAGNTPGFNGPQKNQTAGLRINNGQELAIDGPFTLPLGILTLKLNQTDRSVGPGFGIQRQRAVDITSPILPEIVVGESIVDWTGNPCGTTPVVP